MKRILSALLVLAMMLSLFSCGPTLITTGEEETGEEATATAENPEKTEENTGAHDPTGFAIGFGRADITPENSVPLAGYGNTSYRMSKSVQDKLTINCIAISDGQEKALIFTQDLIRCQAELTEMTKDLVSRQTGVKVENMMFCATHTHSGPDVSSEEGSISVYKKKYYAGAKEAAAKALADLDAVSKIETGAAYTESLNFVRRYLLKDGTILGDNSGTEATKDNPIACHENEIDNQMQIIRITRKNQKPIVLANWGAHPTLTGGSDKYVVSSDYVDPFRKKVEEEADVHCAFFLSAAGNVNTKSRIEGETKYTDYKSHGRALADFCLAALKSGEMTEVSTGSVFSTAKVHLGKINHSTDSMVSKCHEISAVWASNERDKAKALCKEQGISSAFAANAIISRAKMGETMEIPLKAISFGDISFVGAPYEMFTISAMEIKAATPFKMTFVCSCSGGGVGYMPDDADYPHGGYEADTCKFVCGTAEELVACFGEMLNELKAKY